MMPFATFFFNNVDYNIGGSFVPKNSMTQKSSDLMSQYFGNSVDPGSSIVVVSNNTSLRDQADTAALLNLIDELNTSLSSNSSYTGITSIFGVAKQTLGSTASGAKTLLNSTYFVLSSLNSQIFSTINETNSSVDFIYGSPSYYLNDFQRTNNPNASYNDTINFLLSAGSSQLTVPYFNSVIYFWNLSLKAGQTPSTSLMNSSIKDVFTGSLSPFYIILNKSGQIAYFSFLRAIDLNYSLGSYLSYKQATGNPEAIDMSFVNNFSLNYVQIQLSNNGSLIKFLNSTYLNSSTVVKKAYSLGFSPTGDEITALSVNVTGNAMEKKLSDNPQLQINGKTFRNFLYFINGTSNVNRSVDELMHAEAFILYPVLPSSYIIHQFVGYEYSTTIMMVNFKGNGSLHTYNLVKNFVENYSSSIPGSSFYFSSDVASSLQTSNQFTNGLMIALSIGVALSILIVGLFFRSPVAAFFPMLMFGVSSITSMGFNGILDKYLFNAKVSFITPTLLLILLLGLTSDYVVYIMARYRKETMRGNAHAAETATQWSGNAVFTSGFTVALSYVVLWISGIPVFSDSGLTNFIGVAITVVMANTFLIAMLHRFGRKIFWPSKTSLYGKIPLEKQMTHIAEITLKNRKKIMVAFAVISLISLYIYVNTPTGLQVLKLVPPTSATKALKIVNKSFHGDFFERGYVILHFGSPLSFKVGNKTVYNLTEMSYVTQVENFLLNNSQITQVYGPTYPYGYYQDPALHNISSDYRPMFEAQIKSYLGNSTNYAIVYFQPAQLSWNLATQNTVKSIDNGLTTLSHSHNFQFYTGGLSQGLIDSYDYSYSTFMETLPLLIASIFVVLFIQIYSLFTPLRLISMVLLAVVIALAISYVILHYILSLPILIFVPIFVIITLLAVGLDYDIFMITRVREEIIKGARIEDALRTTIRENGGVIVVLGLLLFVTFFALHFTHIGIMDEIGTGLALGVLIDTFVSWPFFVPVVMLYLKKYNWWPSKIGRD